MRRKVPPSIYSPALPFQVEAQMRRGEMPSAFVRRMRVINCLSAITLMKFEESLMAPFDVMDLHHILDQQISQDAIIDQLNSDEMAYACLTGNIRPLWDIAPKYPLLEKGYLAGWIHKFFADPFDPLCVMLAMRAKTLLDLVDREGHSYNLIRMLGYGFIDFGEIPDEEPGDPGDYYPPDIDNPIDYPDVPVPGPGDPGYVPGPGDPGYVPPDVPPAPGDPGYIAPVPGDPGYVAPPEGEHMTPGSGAFFTSAGLSFSPGDLSVPVTPGGKVDPPQCYCEGDKIAYTTQAMEVGERQDLSVVSPSHPCHYSWQIASGGGTLGQDDATRLELSALIDAAADEEERVQIVKDWIDNNKSEEPILRVNPLSEVEHNTYSVKIDDITFLFEAGDDIIIEWIMEYAWVATFPPPLESLVMYIWIVAEDHPGGPGVAAEIVGTMLTIFSNYAADADLLTHEAAHAFAEEQWGDSLPPADSDYQAAIDSEEPPVSAYGMTNPSEDFAEAMMVYADDPVFCEDIAPLRFAAIEALLTGAIRFGEYVTYFAPEDNPECAKNPEIELYCDGELVDSLKIAANVPSGSAAIEHIAGSPLVDPYCKWDGYGWVVFARRTLTYCNGETYVQDVQGGGVGHTCETAEEAVIDAHGQCEGITWDENCDIRSAEALTAGCCPEEWL